MVEKLRTTHRIAGIVVLTILVYLSITGLMVQFIDLRQIFLTHIEPVDPDIQGMLERQGGEFNILTAADKFAQPLPAALDVNAALESVVKSARVTMGDAPLRYVELRMFAGRLIGSVQTLQLNSSYDLATGSLLSQSPVQPLRPVTSIDRLRYQIKAYHRLTVLGNWALWINVVAGLVLFVMIFTGIFLYLKMWRQRKNQGLTGFIWIGGQGKQDDWKRAVHRWVGFTAAIFLLVVAFSGEWLAYESLVFGYRMQHAADLRRAAAGPNGARPAGSGQNGPGAPAGNRNNTPQLLKDADIPALLDVTLNAERQAANGAPIKAIRIRAFGNVQHGVVVAGDGADAKQLTFNARTGQPVRSDPQASGTGFPWGWDAHQLGKAIHRGGYFGLLGRLLDFFAGLSLLYLSVNGLFLYIDFRKERWQAMKSAK